MKVILLERLGRLGRMGDIVNVKNGYARNFLLPKGKALRATEANQAIFEKQKSNLIEQDLERKNQAESIAAKLNGKTFVIIRSAGETGHLYGSVSTRDIVSVISDSGISIAKSQVELNHPIKTIGLRKINIHLHGDVIVPIAINIARSLAEAEIEEQNSSPVVEELETTEEVVAESKE